MPRAEYVVSSPTPTGFRAAKIEGMFDIPHRERQEVHWSVDLPIEDFDWSVGVIVGASGSGKTTLARQMFDNQLVEFASRSQTCILDDFPKGMSPVEITKALTAVGLSSPPVWLRPYSVLSTGQQFRADLALALTQSNYVVFDEFTSVVDRTVAKAASSAVSKHVRRIDSRFVAITCHRDILPWLEPDWVYDMDTQDFHKERLRRPNIQLTIREGHRSWWPLFSQHHYMTSSINQSARVFLAFVEMDGEEYLVGFFSILPAMGMKGWRRGHRTVVLPDFQGLGIGNRMIEETAEYLWQKEGLRFRATTAAPSLIAHRRRYPEMWRLESGPMMRMPSGNKKQYIKTSSGRLSTSWSYVPQELRDSPRSKRSV